MLIATDFDCFRQTSHGEKWPGLLVRYGAADADRVALVVTRAWSDSAPARLRRAWGDPP